MKLNKQIKETVTALHNIVEKNDFNYWCNDIKNYNNTLDYSTMKRANEVLLSILKGHRNIKEI